MSSNSFEQKNGTDLFSSKVSVTISSRGSCRGHGVKSCFLPPWIKKSAVLVKSGTEGVFNEGQGQKIAGWVCLVCAGVLLLGEVLFTVIPSLAEIADKTLVDHFVSLGMVFMYGSVE